MAASNVDLIQMGDSTIACGYRDILELDIHVIFGCIQRYLFVSNTLDGGRLRRLSTEPEKGEEMLEFHLQGACHGRLDRT